MQHSFGSVGRGGGGGVQASCEGGGGVENMQFRASHISKSLKWAIKQNSPA